MARAPKKTVLPVNEGDLVWVAAKVMRVVTSEDGRGIEEVTVSVVGTGHRETFRYEPGRIMPREEEAA